ncbi:S8 family serine peptidase [Thermococcus sp. SY098]|uniref:S8 family serine peptidase n=1 Tax=Thermococcus sp. SY098 TaxID=3111325 RepID=UPI002D764EE4|nr:S8 family serine peptidase [Thermococcus sp. SY098]WRS52253.1 S8 family serine peptidase [Thermococcus sp. SY098]
MNKRTVSLLIVLLMILSAIPVALPVTLVSAENTPQVTHTITKVNAVAKEPEKTVPPITKIEPELLKILEGKVTVDVPEVNGEKLLPIHIVALSNIDSKLKGIQIVGKREIAGMVVYLALVPIKEEYKKVLLKIASLPEVEAVTRTNPFEPVGTFEEPDAKNSITTKTIQIRIPEIRRKIDLSKLEKFSVKKLKLPEIMKLREKSPLRRGELRITERESLNIENPIKPADYFAIYHHGSWNTWLNLGITGAGVNVAVIDSGVDFGNPDLQDAYAVETNPSSPYYGWPIAFSGHSMIWYLLFNYTFPTYIYSWYADTSIELPYFLVHGNVSIGYKGNFTTVFTSMSLANIENDAERAAFINETLAWMGVTNSSRILLVDDDGGWTLDEFYTAALDLLGLNYTIYEVPYGSSGPNATVLSQYDAVIWFTGDTYQYTLTQNDTANLMLYLNNGGKLWLISQDLLEELPLNDTFVTDYLHVAGVDPDYPVPTIIKTANNTYKAKSIYYGFYGSLTDAFADFVFPDNESQVLAVGYEAIVGIQWIDPDTGNVTQITYMKFPMNETLGVPTKSGIFHFGFHPDIALWVDWNGGYIIVADPENATKYDTVYADITPMLVDAGSITLEYLDFNEDSGHTKDNPVIQVDFWDTFNDRFGQDGYADLSGGLIYFIADGVNPIPYEDVVSSSWGLPMPIPENGNLVAFMIGNVYVAGGDHGTLCAAAVGARGRTFFGLTFGNAIGAKIIAEGSLYQGGSWIDYVFFAVEGYDGIPGTGDEALVVSNSYGASSVIAKGYTWDDRFLYWITHFYAPQVSFFFAAGNGGPGYGTVTSEGASPGVITVGAAVEFGYRALFGYDDGPWGYELANYGDVVWFSNRGPNALGQVDPDVLAVGAYALGSLPLNEVGDGFWASDLWAGTSLATPMAAGIAALVYEAYYSAHGTWPTAEEVKEILMSTTKNVNHDVFSQGAGFLDAYRAVQAALNLDGIIVSPSMWQAGETEYPAFANVIYPGDSASQVFEVRNMNVSASKDVEVSAEVFQKIGEVELNVTGNSWYMYRIDPFIPNGTDLMKITLYFDYDYFDTERDYSADAFPWFRVWDVTYVYDPESNTTVPTFNLLTQSLNEGTSISATLGNPLQKFHDGLYVQIRDIFRYYGKTDTYPAKLKLEFYKRVPWNWVTLNTTTLTVPANGTATFMATVTVPLNASYGVYEGAIYLKYDGYETTIPVSVVVASPTPNFEFGGNTNASGLYDNSNVYGQFDWSWRYESGDWRLFYFNVSNVHNMTNAYLIADVSWDGIPTDINLHLLGPAEDGSLLPFSAIWPGIFGPYTLAEVGRSIDGYVGAGMFKLFTTSGTSREVIAAPASPGLHALWLHNVLFDGKQSYRTFSGKIGMASVTPGTWMESINSTEGKKSFIVHLPSSFGMLKATAAGLTAPIIYKDKLAPPTGSADYYTVTVKNATKLSITLTSLWDDLAGVDLDLYVYYNGQLVGASYTSTADEGVIIQLPASGTYTIEVYSWNNPTTNATYDLKILAIEQGDLQVESIKEITEGVYNVTVSYTLSSDKFENANTFYGTIYFGYDAAPMLIEVPVTLYKTTPEIIEEFGTVVIMQPYDLSLNLVPNEGIAEIGTTYTLTTFVSNYGPYDATEAVVNLYKDGELIDQVKLPEFAKGEVYKVEFNIPIDDAELHEYMVVLESPYDEESNVVYVKGVDKVEFSTYSTGNATVTSSFGGYAEITSTDVTNRKITITVDGDHGAVATLLINLPKDLHYYSVHVTDADLLSKELLTTPNSHILKVRIKLHSPATVNVDYMTTGEALQEMNFVWYMLYQRYSMKFNELYNKSIELGIDNETLQEALHYKELAEESYKEAWKFGNPLQGYIRSLPYMRKAYLNIKKAVEILSKAIEKAESS